MPCQDPQQEEPVVGMAEADHSHDQQQELGFVHMQMVAHTLQVARTLVEQELVQVAICSCCKQELVQVAIGC